MTITVKGDSQIMEQVLSKNVGSLVTLRNGSTNLAWTSGGTGDGTTHTGITIDREAISGGAGSLPESAVVGVAYDATLSSGSELTVSLDIQHSVDNSNWSDYQTTAAVVAATGPSGGGVVSGQVNLSVNLSSARRYVRANFVATLTRTSTDTGHSRAVWVLAGYDRLAAPA